MTNNYVRYILTPIVSFSCIFCGLSFAAEKTMSSPIMTAPVSTPSDTSVMKEVPTGTVADLLIKDPNFTTLVSLLKTTDLLTTLKGGNFTIIAPTNAAFDKLPEGSLRELLKPENKDKLKALLSYHVVPGKVTTGDLKAGKLKTLNGKEVSVVIDNGVMINNAKVIKADIIGTNGAVHEVDTVLIP